MSQYELTADSAGVSALLSCTETVNEQANTSTLAITLQLKSRQWYGVTYWLEGTIGDVTLDKSVHYGYLGGLNKYYPVEQTFYTTVAHEPDGTGTAVLTVNLRGTTRSGTAGSGWRIQTAVSVPLTPIARCSGVVATDADIGAVSMIAVSRRNNSYTHTISYSFGKLSGYIGEDGQLSSEPVYCTAAAIGFTVPESFYYELTDAPTGVCTLTCATYDGREQVGVSAQCGFTVTAPKSRCAPVLETQLTDVNPQTLALTGDEKTMVRFCSHVQAQLAARGQYGAEIVEHTLTGITYEPQSNQFDFYARDSRGYETAQTVVMPMVDYVPITANLSCSRAAAISTDAVLTVRGSCYNGSFGAAHNSLRLTVRAGGRAYTLEPVFSGNSYTAICTLEGLDYTVSHRITVEAADLLTTATAQVSLQQGVPVFDWGKRDFAFHVPITAPMINGVTSLALRPWPVGAVLMTVEDQSPAASLGGKWEKLENMGLPLFVWKRLKTADTLGAAILGTMTLGDG